MYSSSLPHPHPKGRRLENLGVGRRGWECLKVKIKANCEGGWGGGGQWGMDNFKNSAIPPHDPSLSDLRLILVQSNGNFQDKRTTIGGTLSFSVPNHSICKISIPFCCLLVPSLHHRVHFFMPMRLQVWNNC